MTGRIPLFLAALSLVAAESAAAQGSLVATRKNVGDTTIVRVVSGSVWGNTVSLVEELRIGKLDGAPAEMFGQIQDVAPDRRGGVFVFDGKVPALRHFDSTGRHVGTLGGRGAGPGEYQDASLGLKVGPDGRLFMRDPRNGRINVYGRDGKPLPHIPVTSGLFTGNSMIIDTSGEFYLKVLLGAIERNTAWPVGIMHLSATGKIIDSLRPPTFPGEPKGAGGYFSHATVWEMSPLGYIVAGPNRTYRFDLQKRGGKLVRVEMDHAPVRLGTEERAEYEAMAEWTRKYRAQFQTAEIPPVPQVKPAYSGFDIGDDGQVWVRVHVAAVKVVIDEDEKPKDPSQRPVISWREPATYDVFQPDGTYLGRVRMPDKVSLVAHRGDEVWGRAAGEFGEQYLVRYRLKHR